MICSRAFLTSETSDEHKHDLMRMCDGGPVETKDVLHSEEAGKEVEDGVAVEVRHREGCLLSRNKYLP